LRGALYMLVYFEHSIQLKRPFLVPNTIRAWRPFFRQIRRSGSCSRPTLPAHCIMSSISSHLGKCDGMKSKHLHVLKGHLVLTVLELEMKLKGEIDTDLSLENAYKSAKGELNLLKRHVFLHILPRHGC
jgi:hypothetical protein